MFVPVEIGTLVHFVAANKKGRVDCPAVVTAIQNFDRSIVNLFVYPDGYCRKEAGLEMNVVYDESGMTPEKEEAATSGGTWHQADGLKRLNNEADAEDPEPAEPQEAAPAEPGEVTTPLDNGPFDTTPQP